MPLYRLTQDAILELPRTSYADKGVKERADLQRLLKANIAVVAPDVMVISEEFGDWEESKRRIDLLGIDRNASLVVIELKRDDEGGHMELQAIRYAAMVSRMTFQRALKAYQVSLDKFGGGDARANVLGWLRTSEPPSDETVLDVRILLVAADFARELTTAVLWLRDWDLDIRCVRVKPYLDASGLLIEVQQIVPLPEAAEYQVTLRDEAVSRREVSREKGEPTGYYFMNTGDSGEGDRAWEDCKQYCFLSAGGGPEYQAHVRSLRVGDRVFAYLSGRGYVGLAEISAEAVPINEFVPPGQTKRLIELPVVATLPPERLQDPATYDWCAAVRWIYVVDRQHAVLKNRFRRPTFQPIKQPALVEELAAALRAAAGM